MSVSMCDEGQTCRRYIVLCIPDFAPHFVLDVSCVTNIKHECRGYNVVCIPGFALRIAVDIACTE